MTTTATIELRSERFIRVLRDCLPQVSQADAERALKMHYSGSDALEIATGLQHPMHRLEQFFAVLLKLNEDDPALHFHPSPEPSVIEARMEVALVARERTAQPPPPNSALPVRVDFPLYRDGSVALLRPMHPAGPDVQLTPYQEATVRWLLKQGIPRGHISGWMRIPADQVSRIEGDAWPVVTAKIEHCSEEENKCSNS